MCSKEHMFVCVFICVFFLKVGSYQIKTNMCSKEHMFVCVLICVFFLKVCSFARLGLVDIRFG